MQVEINGEPHEISDTLTLSALIESLGMKGDRVAVEHNLQIVPRSQWDAVILAPGDKLEIVHFVGGGRSAF
jgi:thiamine biosynthesis protein ThiS